jgi:hypothetical protein
MLIVGLRVSIAVESAVSTDDGATLQMRCRI